MTSSPLCARKRLREELNDHGVHNTSVELLDALLALFRSTPG